MLTLMLASSICRTSDGSFAGSFFRDIVLFHDLESSQESVPPRYQLSYQEVKRICDVYSDTIEQLEFIGCYCCWLVCCHLCCLLVLIE